MGPPGPAWCGAWQQERVHCGRSINIWVSSRTSSGQLGQRMCYSFSHYTSSPLGQAVPASLDPLNISSLLSVCHDLSGMLLWHLTNKHVMSSVCWDSGSALLVKVIFRLFRMFQFLPNNWNCLFQHFIETKWKLPYILEGVETNLGSYLCLFLN